MSITAEQLAARRNAVGASDAPAICGVSPWATPTDVWMSKVYAMDPIDSPAMTAGHIVEPGLTRYVAERFGYTIEVSATGGDVEYADDSRGFPAVAHLDALLGSECGGLALCEVKMRSKGDGWGADGSEEIPDDVMIQTQFALRTSRLSRALVGVILTSPFGGADVRCYDVGPQLSLQDAIDDVVRHFWEYVVSRERPPESPSLETVMRIVRRADYEAIDIPEEMADHVQHWNDLREQRLDIERAEKAAKAEVLALLGDGRAGRLPDGRILKYALESAGPRLDLAALRAAHPDVVERFTTSGTRQVLRLTKGTRS